MGRPVGFFSEIKPMNYSLVQIYDEFRDFSNNLQLNTRETQLVINVRIFAIRHLSVGKRKNA